MDHEVVQSAEMVNKAEAPPPSYDQMTKTLHTIKCTTELTDSTAPVSVDPIVAAPPESVEPTVAEPQVHIYGKPLILIAALTSNTLYC